MRYYELDGNKYPSVTTILKLISTNNDLMKWANYMGFKRKDITKIQDETASFGTLVHSHIQKIVDNDAPDVIAPKDALEQYELDTVLKNFNRYIKDMSYKTILSEKELVSNELQYGGTMDWLVEVNGYNILVDFKTSKKPRPTMYLQLGAYNNLLQLIGIEVDYAGVLTVNQRDCSFHPIDKNSLNHYGRIFNLLYTFYKEWDEKLKVDYSIIDDIKNKSLK